MKSKKLVALAVSSVSMTAFAKPSGAPYDDASDIPGYTSDGGPVVFRYSYVDADGVSHTEQEYTPIANLSGLYLYATKSSGYSFDLSKLGLPTLTKANYTFDGWAFSEIPDTIITEKITDGDYGATFVPVFSQTDEQKAAEAAALVGEATSLANAAKADAEAATNQTEAAAAKAKLDEAKAKLEQAKAKDSTADTTAADTAIADAQTSVDTAVDQYKPSGGGTSSSSSSSNSSSSSSSPSPSNSSSSSSSSSSTYAAYTNPKTGDVSAVPIVFAAVAALGTTGAVLYRKRKAMTD